MKAKGIGAGAAHVDHICSGKNCMFCRIINNPDRPKLVGTKPLVEEKVLERVNEIGLAAAGANTETLVESGDVDDIERLALLDALTELYNSRAFANELKDEVRRARRYKRPLSVCLLTVDDFKEIQAEFGVSVGDLVLKVAAGIVHTSIRDVDIPGRYSSTELAVIFPETNLASAGVAAERIRQKIITQPIAYNWQSFKISASFGLASYPTHANDAAELMQKCSAGLRQAKQRGKGYICSP